tara:strand:+ start:39732 stop:39842 length:111 start_codon:yes stop_codon:yes gene_type:complete
LPPTWRAVVRISRWTPRRGLRVACTLSPQAVMTPRE